MTEINERWKRGNSKVQRLTLAGAAASAALWGISYAASLPAAFGATVTEGWFAFVTIATFIGAVGVTAATFVGVGTIVADDPPLEGQNQ